MKGTYNGPETGEGSSFAFDGDKNVGSGRLTITDTSPPDQVTMRLQMYKPFAADNVVEFTLAPKGDSTDVTWAMEGRQPFLGRVICLFFNMDKMVGTDFAAGLANLKTMARIVIMNRNRKETKMIKTRITPMLWFDNQAEEAASFYISIFKNSKIGNIARYGENMPGPAGSVMVVAFVLDGQAFTALNGGPQFKFTEAISLVVDCKGQQEVDYYWDKLTAGGGAPVQCGWLKDKYGLSWQVVPVEAIEMMSDPNRAKSQRAMEAVMKMIKLDVWHRSGERTRTR